MSLFCPLPAAHAVRLKQSSERTGAQRHTRKDTNHSCTVGHIYVQMYIYIHFSFLPGQSSLKCIFFYQSCFLFSLVPLVSEDICGSKGSSTAPTLINVSLETESNFRTDWHFNEPGECPQHRTFKSWINVCICIAKTVGKVQAGVGQSQLTFHFPLISLS